ncbi:hypothetical protein NEOLEDRAFT_1133514 [Neolentinus lepideus HHB14362 ss-1]|uniref:Uncharacterized protein n=1 Tax=Neolentinus lepideus HHB14362 ss-1 TaxID=1314782 RepID=A0A165SQX3_9AGAM|nr:hypothetical protein NEOLEDRAFT_1133514 [Neolentinus lepideus HHB14362 ss-1]
MRSGPALQEQHHNDRLHNESCVADFVPLVRWCLFADLLWKMTSPTDIMRTLSILPIPIRLVASF